VTSLSFDRRFRGFDNGALGGYAAGAVVAGRIDGPAEVNLRSLPPMGRELTVSERRDDGGLALFDGETLVLEAKPTAFELEIPRPPGITEAEEAGHRLIHEDLGHLYPGCFTCGPDREPGDLDCPSIWAVGEFPENGFNVLARQRVESLAPVPVGEPSIVTAWPIDHDRRKHLTGVAIHDAEGRLLARGESLLVEVPSPGVRSFAERLAPELLSAPQRVPQPRTHNETGVGTRCSEARRSCTPTARRPRAS
jgi:hypothetical protein